MGVGVAGWRDGAVVGVGAGVATGAELVAEVALGVVGAADMAGIDVAASGVDADAGAGAPAGDGLEQAARTAATIATVDSRDGRPMRYMSLPGGPIHQFTSADGARMRTRASTTPLLVVSSTTEGQKSRRPSKLASTPGRLSSYSASRCPPGAVSEQHGPCGISSVPVGRHPLASRAAVASARFATR